VSAFELEKRVSEGRNPPRFNPDTLSTGEMSRTINVERRYRGYPPDMTEVPSLVHPLGYEPPKAEWLTFGADHMARVGAR